jgi:hypothetical protein
MAQAARVDEAFVAKLLAIVTNPEPTGIAPEDTYGLADDGIDRWNGFGREIWVESLEVVDGEYGPELEVTVGLAVPTDETSRIPGRAVTRVPFEREWRRLSGYESPADYAPYVAREAESAAASHVDRHRAAASASAAAESPRDRLPARDVQWRLLLAALAVEGGPPLEVSQGRIEVRLADGDDRADADSPVVTVIVTPDQWEDVLTTHGWRQVETYVAELLGPRDPDEHFLVFYRGDLVRSVREELPPVRGTAAGRRLGAVRPGGWFAVAPPHRNQQRP